MDLALVGLVVPGIENASLDVLVQAVRRAKMSASVVPFSGWPDLETAIGDVLHFQPRVCGVSLPTSESVLPVLSFTRVLRNRGYQGQIVCGGHFATLNAEEILSAPTGVEIVVRFAGEEALLGILKYGRDDEQLAALPGVVFRSKDGAIRTGAPARIFSSSVASTRRGERELPRHLGFPAADVIFSQGCEAHCSYCCIAGKSDLARTEMDRAGKSRSTPVHSHQSPEAIADEIAELFHEHGARVFNFMDDNILPLDADGAALWARELRRVLAAQGVSRVAFSIQARADAISEDSARALAELGVVRAYVGVDGYSASQLKLLGRHAPPEAGPRAVSLLEGEGVFVVVNALLVGPTIRFESILNEIEGLNRIQGAPVHLLPIEVRAGSGYFRAAERAGLLEGGFMMWQYRFADPRTQLIGQVLTSFPTRLAERSVPIALYDLGYNLGIARRLVPEAELAQHVQTYARISSAWNADQVHVLRSAATVVEEGSVEAVRDFIAAQLPRVTAHDRALLERCDAALDEVEREVGRTRRGPVRAHARGRVLGAVALSMSLAGCAGPVHNDQDGGLDGGLDSGVVDAGATCSDPNRVPNQWNTVPCNVGYGYGNGGVLVTFDTSGVAVSFSPGTDGGSISPDVQNCLTTYFAHYCYPSFAGTTQRFTQHLWIA